MKGRYKLTKLSKCLIGILLLTLLSIGLFLLYNVNQAFTIIAGLLNLKKLGNS